MIKVSSPIKIIGFCAARQLAVLSGNAVLIIPGNIDITFTSAFL